MWHINIAVILLSSIVMTSFGWADELDELRAQAAEMRREAEERVQQSQAEAAELKRKVRALQQQAERLQRERPDRGQAEIMEMKRLLEKLRAEQKELKQNGGSEERIADLRGEVQRVERELRELSRDRGGPHDSEPRDHRDGARRLVHMRMAVEHLQQAGLDDEAQHVIRRAEAMERSMHDHQRRGDAMRDIARHMEELRREVRRLRDQVTELMDQRDSRDRDSIRRRDRGDVERDSSPRRPRSPRDPGPAESNEERRERE